MKRIKDLGLDYFINEECRKKYKEIAEDTNLNTAEKIYNLMTLNPGFMKDTETDEKFFIEKTKKTTFNEIERYVKKKREIILVAFHFNLKPSIKKITNGLIGPDASDFLTLLHLNLLTKTVRSFYEPGFSIRIGSEISYFHYFALVDLEVAQEFQMNLLKLNNISSNLLNQEGAVFIYDTHEETERYKEEFTRKLEYEKNKFIQLDNSLELLEGFSSYYFNNVIDKDKFPSDSVAWRFSFFHTLDATGYKNALLNMFNSSNGLFRNYDKTIYIQTRFIDDSHANKKSLRPDVYCSLFPGAKTFSFNLLTLKRNDGKWEQISYQDVEKQNYKPFYVRDIPYPFFFIEERENDA